MRWVTFDCFGTLVDWRHGLRTSAELIAPGQGERLLEAYNRHEHAVQAESPRLRYRHVLAETLRRACAEEKIELSDDDATVAAATLPYWPVFPEVGAELSALRAAGWNLALLTNCDRDLIAGTLRRLPVPFDAVVTAEDAGDYKPSQAHFATFRRAHEPSDWVHVAQSYFHDMVPAHRLGIRRVWINRLGERAPDDSIIQRALPDLHGLLTAVQSG
ncbi:HAD hydrolase-like protein [Actinomadura sp. ATCC 31491]|uniref:HAD hydrolase-like protein n=1 Tax=Actinomadura luzonensis TaxID=2805427 RepID=A0ABT0GBQ4_9ACTN|nr:HAD family hydrolase [Actinomadura luzonensis]MCK2221506.1 HAD hydrolase-like protein [Actinomadura luzonensis]